MKDKEPIENIRNTIQNETQKRVKAEPVLASFFHTTILEHSSFSAAIADLIANDLGSSSVQPMMLRSVIKDAINSSEEILVGTMTDLIAAKEKILPANICLSLYCFLKDLSPCNPIE